MITIKYLKDFIKELEFHGVSEETEVCCLNSDDDIFETKSLKYDETDIPALFIEF